VNIKSRLKKIEDQVITPDSNFCQCPSENVIHLIEPRLDEPRGYCAWCRGVCTFNPDLPCEKCKKPVLSKYIKVEPKEEEENYES
jgi:hypothetical protein